MASLSVRFVRSFIFAVLFYPITAVYVTLAAIGSLFGDRAMHRIVTSWAQSHRLLCRVILRQKIQIIGALPKGQMLYVFKHESMFETIDMLCMIEAPIVIAKQELLNIPGWGWIARRHGMIGLHRSAGASALRYLQKQAKMVRASGRPICLFPEGTRVPHGEAPPVKAGFAALYQLLKLPVVPIAVDSGLYSPRRSFIKKPGTIHFKIGEIIPPGLPRGEAETRIHAAINALNAPSGDRQAPPT